MIGIEVVPCWTCPLCKRLDGVQDPDTCPYEDRLCPEFRAWAARAWRDVVEPLRAIKSARTAPAPAQAKAKKPAKPAKRKRVVRLSPESLRRDRAIQRRYRAGKSDAIIEKELSLKRGTVYEWRKRHGLPTNSTIHGVPLAYWTIYLSKTDKLVAQGDTNEVLQQLGMTVESFRSAVRRTRHGTLKKYTILKNGRNIR